MSKVIIGLVIIVLLGIVAVEYAGHNNVVSIRNAELLDKDRIVEITDGNSNSYYLIFTDKGEFKITDDLLRGNHKSSTWYGSMKIGESYNFTVDGFRNNAIITSYQNIISEPKLVR